MQQPLRASAMEPRLVPISHAADKMAMMVLFLGDRWRYSFCISPIVSEKHEIIHKNIISKKSVCA